MPESVTPPITAATLEERLWEMVGDSLSSFLPPATGPEPPGPASRDQLFSAIAAVLTLEDQAIEDDPEAAHQIHRHRLVIHALQRHRLPSLLLRHDTTGEAADDPGLVAEVGGFVVRAAQMHTPEEPSSDEPGEPPQTTNNNQAATPENGSSDALHPDEPMATDSPIPTQRRNLDVTIDEQLVTAAVSGDERAKAHLLGKVHPLVLRYCRARLGKQERMIGTADDVAQEVCLALFSALPNYTAIQGRPFLAFVYGIAGHKVVDAFRAVTRDRSEPVADLPDQAIAPDNPEGWLLNVELRQQLAALLDKLPERYREVLILRVVVGLSTEETAQAMDSTPGTIRVTQHRALKKLRRLAGIITQPDNRPVQPANYAE